MKVRLYTENTWLYPDQPVSAPQPEALYIARGGHAGFQLFTDAMGGAACMKARLPEGIAAKWYRMSPVSVEMNSGANTLTAQDYESVRDIVTRKAPFAVYDMMEEIDSPDCCTLPEGRTVLFLRLEAAMNASAGVGEAQFQLDIAGESADFRLPLTVSRAVIPPSEESAFSVNNWLNYQELFRLYGADNEKALRLYLRHLRSLRGNHLKLPSGDPIRDENRRIVDFDFSLCGRIARIALEEGFRYILGGFVARFRVWDEPEQYLLWDRDVAATSMEGYRQLKLYFTRLWELVTDRGWQDRWMQCLVDEPQFPNSMSYRALSGICRKCMPGVVINDPVETTDIQGAADIWCVKQAVFDKYREAYKQLQAMGERLTVYTCGFPAGKWMNRATDLPLLAGRLAFWRCAAEGFEGFLHWGYNSYGGEDPLQHNCYPEGNGIFLPPGNGFIVYPGKDGPIDTLRSQIQLFGAEDAELLRQLPTDKAAELIGSLTSDFEQYDADEAHFEAVRAQMMRAVSG